MAKKLVKIKVQELDDFQPAQSGLDAGISEEVHEVSPETEDSSPVPKSSCAIWSIFLALFIILLLIIGSLFYLKTKKFSLIVPKVNLNTNTSQHDFMSDEEVTIKLTEAQIQNSINADDANFPLKKAKIKVNSDKILLSGKTSNSFWGVSVEVGIVPKVESGKVQFDITEIKSAGVTAPKSISDLVNKNLSQYLDGLSSSVGNIEVSKVELNDGYVMVTGKQQ